MAYPGIPEDVLTSLEDPNPLDLGILKKEVAAFASPPDAPLQTLVHYGRLVLAGNQRMNLTGAKNWETLIEAHFVDCLRAAQFLPDEVRTVADWGSGAGFPGILWSILFPEKRFLLCEKRQKRVEFLEDVLMRLELFHAEVLPGQAQEALRDEEELVDALVARAVEPLPRFLARIRQNKVRFGALFLMAGPSWKEDWEGMSAKDRSCWKLAAHHPYSLLGDRGKRHVLIFRPGS